MELGRLLDSAAEVVESEDSLVEEEEAPAMNADVETSYLGQVAAEEGEEALVAVVEAEALEVSADSLAARSGRLTTWSLLSASRP